MPISHAHKACFVHIPKTGGQSIADMFGIGRQDLSQYRGREVKEGQTWTEGLVLTHLTIEHIKQRMDVSGYYIFAFVRNPYTRIISEYNWRMRNRAAFEEPTSNLLTFERYCELLLSKWGKIMANPNITERQHVTPQYKYVDSSVDIYRYETFERDCIKIQKRLGINVPIPRVNAGGYDTKHTERTIEITNELYGEDFKTFGYDHITQA